MTKHYSAKLIYALIIFCFIFLITSCGGGGSSSGAPSTGNETSTGNEAPIAPSGQMVSVSIPPTMTSSSLKVVTGDTVQSLGEGGQIAIPDISEQQYVVVEDEAEKIIYMSMALGVTEEEPVEVNASTTALALLALSDEISAVFNEYPDKQLLLQSSILEQPKVFALSEVIDKQIFDGSYDLENMNTELEFAIADAYEQAIAAIGSIAPQLESAVYNVVPMRVGIDESGGQWKSYESTPKSGLSIRVVGEEDPYANQPSFKVFIENDYRRWVWVDLDSLGLTSFMLPPEEDSYTIPGEAESFPLVLVEQKITAIGPGLNGSLPSSDVNTAKYYEAWAYTITDEIIINNVARWSGNMSCVKSIFHPVPGGTSFIQSLSNNIRFKDAINSEDIRGISDTAYDTAINLLESGVVGCLKRAVIEKTIMRLFGIKSKIDNIIDVFETMLDISYLYADLKSSFKYIEWTLVNNIDEEDKNFNMGAVDGSLNILISSDEKYQYDGNCPEGTICKRFYWLEEVRPTVEFNTVCNNQGSDNSCRSITLQVDGLEDFTVDATDQLIYTFPEKETANGVVPEYSGVLWVKDFDEAFTDYPFRLQAALARPHLDVWLDGQKIEPGSTYIVSDITNLPTLEINNKGIAPMKVLSATTDSPDLLSVDLDKTENIGVFDRATGTFSPVNGTIPFGEVQITVTTDDIEEEYQGEFSFVLEFPELMWSWSGTFSLSNGEVAYTGASIIKRSDGTYWGNFNFGQSRLQGPATINGGYVEIVDNDVYSEDSHCSYYVFDGDQYVGLDGPYPYTRNQIHYGTFNVGKDITLNWETSYELFSGEECRKFMEENGYFERSLNFGLGMTLNDGSVPIEYLTQ